MYNKYQNNKTNNKNKNNKNNSKKMRAGGPQNARVTLPPGCLGRGLSPKQAKAYKKLERHVANAYPHMVSGSRAHIKAMQQSAPQFFVQPNLDVISGVGRGLVGVAGKVQDGIGKAYSVGRRLAESATKSLGFIAKQGLGQGATGRPPRTHQSGGRLGGEVPQEPATPKPIPAKTGRYKPTGGAANFGPGPATKAMRLVESYEAVATHNALQAAACEVAPWAYPDCRVGDIDSVQTATTFSHDRVALTWSASTSTLTRMCGITVRPQLNLSYGQLNTHNGVLADPTWTFSDVTNYATITPPMREVHCVGAAIVVKEFGGWTKEGFTCYVSNSVIGHSESTKKNNLFGADAQVIGDEYLNGPQDDGYPVSWIPANASGKITADANGIMRLNGRTYVQPGGDNLCDRAINFLVYCPDTVSELPVVEVDIWYRWEYKPFAGINGEETASVTSTPDAMGTAGMYVNELKSQANGLRDWVKQVRGEIQAFDQLAHTTGSVGSLIFGHGKLHSDLLIRAHHIAVGAGLMAVSPLLTENGAKTYIDLLTSMLPDGPQESPIKIASYTINYLTALSQLRDAENRATAEAEEKRRDEIEREEVRALEHLIEVSERGVPQPPPSPVLSVSTAPTSLGGAWSRVRGPS